MPCSEDLAISTTVPEENFAAGVGEELGDVWALGASASGTVGGDVEKVDVLDEARAVGYKITGLFLHDGAASECVAEGRHQDLDVSSAGWTGVEVGKVHVRLCIDDTVPVLAAYYAAGALTTSRGRSCDSI